MPGRARPDRPDRDATRDDGRPETDVPSRCRPRRHREQPASTCRCCAARSRTGSQNLPTWLSPDRYESFSGATSPRVTQRMGTAARRPRERKGRPPRWCVTRRARTLMVSTMGANVRKAELGDLDAIVAFGSAVIPPYYTPILGEHAAQAQLSWWSLDRMAPAVEAGRVHVVATDRDVVGVCQTGELAGERVVGRCTSAEHRPITAWSCSSRRSHRFRGSGSCRRGALRRTPEPAGSTNARVHGDSDDPAPTGESPNSVIVWRRRERERRSSRDRAAAAERWRVCPPSTAGDADEGPFAPTGSDVAAVVPQPANRPPGRDFASERRLRWLPRLDSNQQPSG